MHFPACWKLPIPKDRWWASIGMLQGQGSILQLPITAWSCAFFHQMKPEGARKSLSAFKKQRCSGFVLVFCLTRWSSSFGGGIGWFVSYGEKTSVVANMSLGLHAGCTTHNSHPCLILHFLTIHPYYNLHDVSLESARYAWSIPSPLPMPNSVRYPICTLCNQPSKVYVWNFHLSEHFF